MSRTAIIGHGTADAVHLARQLPGECVFYEMLPRIVLADGVLRAESPTCAQQLTFGRVIFHGIFEHDLPFLSALALWGGPCFPAPLPMVDCRLRLPALARALNHTRFAAPPRGYVGPGATFVGDGVAKWSDWHCGENKARFAGQWASGEPCLIEPFFEGEAVRVCLLGDRAFQIRMAGEGWLKSVHGAGAALTEADPELVADARAVQAGLGLSLIANDYMVGPNGTQLLEVNHIPSVTCFPELWAAYVETVVAWATRFRG